MLLVTRDTVGSHAFARMVRSGILVELTDSAALAWDVAPTPHWRALAVQHLVPAHTVLSGLGGVWVHHGGRCPDPLIVVGKRGLHRTGVRPPRGTGTTLRFHSGKAATEEAISMASIRVATRARCAVDALRWDDHQQALPLLAALLRERHLDIAHIDQLVCSDSAVGAGYSRMASAWQALKSSVARD